MRTREIVSLVLAGGVVVGYWLVGPDPGEPFPGATTPRPVEVGPDVDEPARARAAPETPPDEPPPGDAPETGEPLRFEQRPARDEVGPPDDRRVIAFRPGPSADTIALTATTSDYLLEDAIVQASTRTALICYQGRGPFENVTLRNVLIAVEPGVLPLDRSYWAIRGYDMIDTLLERVEITGFGRVTEKHDEGHAIYLNVAGALTIEDSYLHHNGGQGLQLVNRPKESSLPSGPAAGTITIRNTRFHENGFNPDRGGFQISIFGTGQPIVMSDVEIVAGFDRTVWPDGGSRGGLVLEAEPYDPNRPEKPVWWRPAELPKGWHKPFAQGRTELVRVTVHHRAPDRPIVQIKGCEELIITECTFVGGRVVLDDPTKPGRPSGRIVWEGNRGDASVFHRGRRIGTASEDFVIEAGKVGSGR